MNDAGKIIKNTSLSGPKVEQPDYVNFILHPLRQDYRKETSIAVFVLNPKGRYCDPFDNMQHVYDILTKRGYTRLYMMHLFPRIGDLNLLIKNPGESLFAEQSDRRITEIMPDVSKAFLAYGDPVNQQVERLITQRLQVVKMLAVASAPNVGFFRFGELSSAGHPKSMNEIHENDVEVPHDLSRML
jgi:Protein of unknown function (DUF1643)